MNVLLHECPVDECIVDEIALDESVVSRRTGRAQVRNQIKFTKQNI